MNEVHWNTLKNAYEKGLLDENGRLKTISLTKKKVDKELLSNTDGLISAYDAEKGGMDINTLEKEGKIYHIDVPEKNDFFYEYDATDFFMSKIGTSFGGFENFQLADLKTPKYHYTEKFIVPFLVSVDSHYGEERYVNKGSRRCGVGIAEKEEAFIEELKDDRKMHISTSAYPFKNEDNGKYAWQALLNMDEMENPISPKIYVSVKVAQMKPYRYHDKIVEDGNVHTAVTMITE